MASNDLFKMERLSNMEIVCLIDNHKIYRSSSKSFVVVDEEKDIIVTVALKSRGFEPQRVYVNCEKVIGNESREPRMIAKKLCVENVDVEYEPSDRKSSGTSKKSNEAQFIEFLTEKFDFNLDEIKKEFEIEQEERKKSNEEIEKQIKLLMEQLKK